MISGCGTGLATCCFSGLGSGSVSGEAIATTVFQVQALVLVELISIH